MKFEFLCDKIKWYFLSSALCLTACTTPAPDYRFNDISVPSAELSFESDFVLHTHFAVNITDAQRNACSDYKRAGYLLYDDSIFLYDKSNRSIKIQVPANQAIAIKGLHQFNDPARSEVCGPLFSTFVPEAGAKYIVRFANQGNNQGTATNYDISRIGNPAVPTQNQRDWVGVSGGLSCSIIITKVDESNNASSMAVQTRSQLECNK